MENKMIFREMLSEVKKLADASGNIVTKDEIRALFAELPLEEEHFSMVFDYLASQNIRVVDSREEAQEYLPEEDQDVLSIYVEELMQLEKELPDDEHRLMLQLLAGDEEAKLHIIERYLPVICARADEYTSEELPAEDLIQEGNLGLLMALSSLEGYDSPAAIRAHILNSINDAMAAAIESSRKSSEKNQGIVNRVNHLNEAVNNLEEDLGHKVSAEELSAYLEMPMEEIRDILRMSGDQIDVDGK
jgi:RNA polymerase primary sigma factor